MGQLLAVRLPGGRFPGVQAQQVTQHRLHAGIAVGLGQPGMLDGGVEFQLRGVDLAGHGLQGPLRVDQLRIPGRLAQHRQQPIHAPRKSAPMVSMSVPVLGILSSPAPTKPGR